jgi:hypothetical protein
MGISKVKFVGGDTRKPCANDCASSLLFAGI